MSELRTAEAARVAESRDDAWFEVQRLRSLNRDLISLLAQPAIGTGQMPAGVIKTLVDVLLSMLRVDLAYARVTRLGEAAIEAASASARPEIAKRAPELGAALERWLKAGTWNTPITIEDPLERGEMRMLVGRFGLHEDSGVIAVGSHRQSFPTETEALLFRVAINQAVIGFQGAQLLQEHQRVERPALEAASLGTWDYDPLTGDMTWSDRCKELFGQPPDAKVDYQVPIEKLVGTLLEVVLEQGGARKGYLVLARDGALSIEAEAILGEKGVATRLLRSLPAESSPLIPVSVVRYARLTRQPVILDDAAAGAGKFAADAYFTSHKPRLVLCLPILRQAELLGLLYLENDLVTGAFKPDRLTALALLAFQAAISVENALLLAQERAARAAAQEAQTSAEQDGAAAEEAERRSAFLAAAGALLTERLDYEETLARLSRLCVRSLADWCVLDIFEGGDMSRMAGACADPAKEPLLERLRERHPARMGSPHPAASCLRDGRPILIPELTEEHLQSFFEDDEHREFARALGTRSLLVVPLVARGQTIGVLTMCSATPRRYGRPDIELVQEVAHRAGLAIDNARLYRDAQGAIQALRESEERLRLAQDAAKAGTWEWDLRTNENFWSEGLWELYGLEPHSREPSYEAWRQTIHPEDRPRAEQVVQDAARSGTELNAEWRVRSRDGTERWLMSRGCPVRDADERVVRYIGICVDITDRKRAEEELRQGDQRKSEFLGVLSHELRNPLAPIRTSIHILDRAPPGSREAARAKEIIQRQTEHLSRLVDDLLDVTRISHGKIELRREYLDAREVVRRTSEDHRTLFEQSEIRLSIVLPPHPVWIDADATRISQAVGNLLQNAVKFTPAAGIVSVAVETEGAAAVVRVRDSGLGMEQSLVEQVFEPFVQAKQSLARTRGGLGLGLALAKGLVNLHGGTVSATSEGLGMGSEFVIRLPLALQPRARAGVTDARPTPIVRSVLIIEDNADAGQSLVDVMELSGHRARVARDGKSGIALAREMKPDVILCDIGLPDIDGYEIARTLRTDEALRSTRLIALSGYAQPEDKERAKEAGFDGHLCKPPPVNELQELLVDRGADALDHRWRA